MITAARGTFTVKGCMAILKIPSLCTPRVLQWSTRWADVGTIHGRRNVATHHRKPLVNRTRLAWLQRYKLFKSVTTAGRPAGRSCSDFTTVSRRTRSAFGLARKKSSRRASLKLWSGGGGLRPPSPAFGVHPNRLEQK